MEYKKGTLKTHFFIFPKKGMLSHPRFFCYGQGKASSHTSIGVATFFAKNKRNH
jgi:hypothetical protein